MTTLADASHVSKHPSRLSTPTPAPPHGTGSPLWHRCPNYRLQWEVPHHEKSIRTAQRTWQWASGINLHSNCAKSLNGGKVKTLFTLRKAVNVAPVELFRSCRRLYRDTQLHFLTQNLNDGVSVMVVLYWWGRVCCFVRLTDGLVVKCKNCKQSRQMNTFCASAASAPPHSCILFSSPTWNYITSAMRRTSRCTPRGPQFGQKLYHLCFWVFSLYPSSA